jgi:hypothetical protein
LSPIHQFNRKYTTHAKLATITIDLTANDGEGPTVEEIQEGLLSDLERRIEDKDFK